jgi:uncharacterized protein YjiS (DUF1127 family)
MSFLSTPNSGLARKLRYRKYCATRAQLESLSNADLADIGLKRYQLGHIARVKALT